MRFKQNKKNQWEQLLNGWIHLHTWSDFSEYELFKGLESLHYSGIKQKRCYVVIGARVVVWNCFKQQQSRNNYVEHAARTTDTGKQIGRCISFCSSTSITTLCLLQVCILLVYKGSCVIGWRQLGLQYFSFKKGRKSKVVEMIQQQTVGGRLYIP